MTRASDIQAEKYPAQNTVALFVTCLVDLYRPAVAFAAVRLIEKAGFDVVVPQDQTCCGQPAYNAGAQETARKLARNVINCLEGYAKVIIPSGSCAGMMIKHYPGLFAEDEIYGPKAQALAARVEELTQFLGDKSLSLQDGAGKEVAFHNSCPCKRELGVSDEPLTLLRDAGFQPVEPARSDVCCGFGGGFSVKYTDVSGAMAAKKCTAIRETEAKLLVSADLGCLLQLAGRLARENSDIEVRHIAEVLAGNDTTPAIGAQDK